MITLNKDRADRLMVLLPPARFDAICTEELAPDWKGLRATLYANTLTQVYVMVESVVAEGNPDPLDEPEKLTGHMERAVRHAVRAANRAVGEGLHAPKSEGGLA